MTKIIKIILSILILSFNLTTLSYSQSNELREFFKNSKSAYKSGNLIKAMHFTSKAIELSKKDFGIEHFYTATLIANLGLIQFEKALYEESKLSFIKALTIRKKVLETDHDDIAETLNYIALANRKLFNYNKALEYHNEALLIMSRSITKSNPHAINERTRKGALYKASAMHTKALIEIKNDNIFEAIGLLKTASRIFLHSLGKDKTELIEAYEELYQQAKKVNDTELIDDIKKRLNKLNKEI